MLEHFEAVTSHAFTKMYRSRIIQLFSFFQPSASPLPNNPRQDGQYLTPIASRTPLTTYQAPTQGKKRPSLRAKARPARPSSSSTSHPTSTTHTYHSSSSTFSATKKDKRTIKHSTFVNKIAKAHATPKKRRRPSKKLVTTLESLADALPDDIDGEDQGAANGDGATTTVVGQARIRHKSLRSRPGAMKRKEKVERMERERFERNMAQMQEPAQAGGAVPAEGTANRWAALRGFIEATMERKKEFQQQG